MTNPNLPTIAIEYLALPSTNNNTQLNFKDMFSASCIHKIIQTNDIQQSR